MFLCSRSFRRVHTLNVRFAFPPSRNAPLAYYRYQSTSAIPHVKPYNECADATQNSSAAELVNSTTSTPSPKDTLTKLDDKVLENLLIRTENKLNRDSGDIKCDLDNSPIRTDGATYVDVYLELRSRGFPVSSTLRHDLFVRMAQYYFDSNSGRIFEIIKDALKYSGTESEDRLVEQRLQALQKLCHISMSSIHTLGKITTQNHILLIRLLKKTLLDQRPASAHLDLTANSLNNMLKSAITLELKPVADNISFLEALLREVQAMDDNKFIANTSTEEVRHATDSKGTLQDELAWNFMCTIRLLLVVGKYDLSFSYLQVAVQKGMIPPGAIDNTVANIDFRAFMVSILVRSCVYYGWAGRSLDLLNRESMAKIELTDHHSALLNEVMAISITNDRKDLLRCSRLVKHALSQNTAITMDKTLIRTFYTAAYMTNARKAAEILYTAMHRRINPIRLIDPPEGSALVWLFNHLVRDSEDRSLGQILAQEIREFNKKPIDPYERGNIIALCAGGGYVEETRVLWDRYTKGPEGEMVAGHTQSMVGIVKLFKKLSDTNDKNVKDVDHTKETIGEAEEKASSQKDSCFAGGSPMQDIKTSQKADSVPGNQVFAIGDDGNPEVTDSPKPAFGGLPDAGEQINSGVPFPNAVKRDSRGDGPEYMYDDPAVVEKMANDEYYAFAIQVLRTYQNTKEPLTQASHYDLNALARAADVLGLVRKSMHALKVIVDRKEVPDTHDLNIVITAMAGRDPERAEAMLLRMVSEGMHINAFSFSAVVVGALKHGDLIRASRVYSRATRAGFKDLTQEAAVALAYACIDAVLTMSLGELDIPRGRARKEVHKTYLRQTYGLVTTNSKLLARRNFGPQCVGAALRVGEARLAFHFWKQTIKTNMGWDWKSHEDMRHRITQLVDKTMSEGKIGAREGARMISELGVSRV